MLWQLASLPAACGVAPSFFATAAASSPTPNGDGGGTSLPSRSGDDGAPTSSATTRGAALVPGLFDAAYTAEYGRLLLGRLGFESERAIFGFSLTATEEALVEACRWVVCVCVCPAIAWCLWIVRRSTSKSVRAPCMCDCKTRYALIYCRRLLVTASISVSEFFRELSEQIQASWAGEGGAKLILAEVRPQHSHPTVPTRTIYLFGHSVSRWH